LLQTQSGANVLKRLRAWFTKSLAGSGEIDSILECFKDVKVID
jgi:hypothetical protein